MKKMIFGVALVMLAGMAVSCLDITAVKGSGKAAKGAFDISLNYTELSVQSGIKVVLVPSEVGEGYITADEEVMGYVSIVEKNGRVTVSYEPRIMVRSSVETVVTMPISGALAWLKASSAGKIESEAKLVCDGTLRMEGSSAASIDVEVEAPEVSVDVNSAAKCSLSVQCGVLRVNGSSAANFDGKILVRELYADFDSASNCRIEGSTDLCDVETDSAGHFRGFDLVCKKADLDASSAGSIEITVFDELYAEVSSGASVRYRGAPAIVHPDISSGGSLKRVSR